MLIDVWFAIWSHRSNFTYSCQMYVVQAYSKSHLFSAYVRVFHTTYNSVSLLSCNWYEFSVPYDGIIHSGA